MLKNRYFLFLLRFFRLFFMIIFTINPIFMNIVIVTHNFTHNITHNLRITVRFSHNICLVFDLTFLNNRAIMTYMYNIEGITLTEMAHSLSLPQRTVERRVQRAGIRPLTHEALYPLDTLEKIRLAKRGRPRKTPEKQA